jgi:hypothetical protein
MQFGIRSILIATTLVAVTFAAAPIFNIPNSILNWIMIAALVAIMGWAFFQRAPVRARMGATLACLFLPFAWIIPYSRPFGHTSGLLEWILISPGLMPSVFLSSRHVDDSTWAVVFVMMELVIGIWLARRGGRLALAYTLFILGLSTVSSFGFHVLYRM